MSKTKLCPHNILGWTKCRECLNLWQREAEYQKALKKGRKQKRSKKCEHGIFGISNCNECLNIQRYELAKKRGKIIKPINQICHHGIKGKTKCKDCKIEYNRKRNRDSKRKIYNKEYLRKYYLIPKNRYKKQIGAFNKAHPKIKFTIDGYFKLWELQNQCCAICKTQTPNFNVSWHIDHKEDKVRGLLCGSCNSQLVAWYENNHEIKNILSIENPFFQFVEDYTSFKLHFQISFKIWLEESNPQYNSITLNSK